VVDIDIKIWVVGPHRDRAEVDPDLIEFVRDMDLTPVSTEEERESMEKPPDPGFDDNLERLSVPVLTIVGEHDQPGMDQAARHLAQYFDAPYPVTIAGAAHLPSLEQPESFNHALNNYLARL
jgi:pimeloyl-ACP methyl ester carboxylesterase